MIRVLVVLLLLAACAGSDPASAPATVAASCTYDNPWSKAEECRDYLGDWFEEETTKDCADQKGIHTPGAACSYPAVLGHCVIDGSVGFVRLSFPGTDATKCDSTKSGCEFFGGGTFEPSPTCKTP